MARSLILERNHEEDADEPLRVDAEGEKKLIAAARKMGPIEFVHTFAAFPGVTPVMAQSIVEDASGDALAVACRGVGLCRTTYSALAIFAAGRLNADAASIYQRLAAFDTIPESGARRMLNHWRGENARAA